MAIDKLRDAGWQDDARFAETLIRSRAATGYGPLHIRAELATHGLGREAIAVAMDGFDCDWSANARDLVRRRFGVIPAGDRQPDARPRICSSAAVSVANMFAPRPALNPDE